MERMSEHVDGRCEVAHRHTLACSTPTPTPETTRAVLGLLRGGEGRFAEYVARVVAEAPPLTAERREKIAGLLGGQATRAAQRPVPYTPPPKPKRPCFLYRHFDEFDGLLYVGISFDPVQRTRAHHRHAAWAQFAHRADVQEFADEDAAREAEREAIQSERPVFNVVHSTTADRTAALITYMHQRARKAST